MPSVYKVHKNTLMYVEGWLMRGKRSLIMIEKLGNMIQDAESFRAGRIRLGAVVNWFSFSSSFSSSDSGCFPKFVVDLVLPFPVAVLRSAIKTKTNVSFCPSFFFFFIGVVKKLWSVKKIFLRSYGCVFETGGWIILYLWFSYTSSSRKQATAEVKKKTTIFKNQGKIHAVISRFYYFKFLS